MSKWTVEIDGIIRGYIWAYTQSGAIVAAADKFSVISTRVKCYPFED